MFEKGQSIPSAACGVKTACVRPDDGRLQGVHLQELLQELRKMQLE